MQLLLACMPYLTCVISVMRIQQHWLDGLRRLLSIDAASSAPFVLLVRFRFLFVILASQKCMGFFGFFGRIVNDGFIIKRTHTAFFASNSSWLV